MRAGRHARRKRRSYCSRQGRTVEKPPDAELSRLVDNIGKQSPDHEIIILNNFDGLVFGIGRHEVEAVSLQGKALQGSVQEKDFITR